MAGRQDVRANLLLMTETVTPGADDILAAVECLSDVPIRR